MPSLPPEKFIPLSGTFSKAASPSDYPSSPTPSPQYPKVGECLQDFHQAWAAQRASSWIREGYHLEFQSPPPLSLLAPVVMPFLDPRKMETLQEQFNALLEKRALEPIPPGTGPGFFSRIFVVPKCTNPVLNCFLWLQLGRPSLGSQTSWICQSTIHGSYR